MLSAHNTQAFAQVLTFDPVPSSPSIIFPTGGGCSRNDTEACLVLLGWTFWNALFIDGKTKWRVQRVVLIAAVLISAVYQWRVCFAMEIKRITAKSSLVQVQKNHPDISVWKECVQCTEVRLAYLLLKKKKKKPIYCVKRTNFWFRHVCIHVKIYLRFTILLKILAMSVSSFLLTCSRVKNMSK